MSKVKTQAESRDKATSAPVTEQHAVAASRKPGGALSSISRQAAASPNGASNSAHDASLLDSSNGADSSASSRAREMASMQRSVGNARLSRLLDEGHEAEGASSQQHHASTPRAQPASRNNVQTLAVSHPDSAAEREAESVSRRVVAGQNAPAIKPLAAESVQTLAQRVETGAATKGLDTASASDAIARKGAGSPVSPALRRALEPRMGADLGAARVHQDSSANDAAAALDARAFTHGQDIFLARGESPNDRALMAHELTHVIQQTGASSSSSSAGMVSRAPQAKTPVATKAGEGKSTQPQAPKGAKPGAEELVAPGVLELKGKSNFALEPAIEEYLEAHKDKDVVVQTRFGKMAEGPLKIKKQGKDYYHARPQPLSLRHPIFTRIGEVLPGLEPSLIVSIEKTTLKGHLGLAAESKLPTVELEHYLEKAPDLIGLAGFNFPALPKLTNKLEGGQLHLGLSGVKIRLGSAFDGTVNFEAIDEAITFDGNVNVDIKGAVKGTLDLKRAADGLITGKVTLDLQLPKNFSGSAEVEWDGRAVTGQIKAGYQGEKLSGTLILYLMEKSKAEALKKEKQAPPEEAGKTPAPVAENKPKGQKVNYVLFGEGDLSFAFNEWLNGTAHVIVDYEGYVTIIGKITPQKEFNLFGEPPQKEWVKQLFKLEARAAYGIPVVGDIFIFANVSLDAFAKLGPAKFYNIVVQGTYSTDPAVSKDFSIQGSINISAAAGLRLRAEAGVGIEILSHDIKAGAGINGIAGVKAYAEATPVIGYREKPAAAGEDKKGEFFMRGDLEIAAQPFLGLSGDLFVEISTPWWSPLSDKKWTWPLFNKEYPIGGSLGMLASVDYVFGSNQWPSIELKPVDFNGEKFMTDMYNDNAKPKSAEADDQKGQWKEKNAPDAEPPTAAEGKKGDATPGKPAALPPAKSKVQPGGAHKPTKEVDPHAKTAEGKSVKELKAEAEKKGKKPAGSGTPAGAKQEDTAKGSEKKTHDDELAKGLAALDAVTARYAQDGAPKDEVVGGVKSVRRKFKVFKSIEVIDGGETWDYEYVATPGKKQGPKKKGGKKGPEDVAKDDQIQVKGGKWVLAKVTLVVPGDHIEYEQEDGKGRGKLSDKSYGKLWRRYVPEAGFKTGPAWDAIQKLNDWGRGPENYPDARQALNHRYHRKWTNPSAKQWHHIHEQSTGNAPNNVTNLAITDSSINQAYNVFYGQKQEGTGSQSLRDWLKGQPDKVHDEWGRKTIRLHRNTLHSRQDIDGRPYQEIT